MKDTTLSPHQEKKIRNPETATPAIAVPTRATAGMLGDGPGSGGEDEGGTCAGIGAIAEVWAVAEHGRNCLCAELELDELGDLPPSWTVACMFVFDEPGGL
eukprot:TRINITY_DN67223_c6_g2_i2.p2 TRINITY_DN67223_c6_g2~~TRINITY_DN67223_c6_g2_i2.p2  ORF type:complete len:101 (+),score=8.04 TRINITY_DN67223_c6_g2_i2:271-573(+)